MERRSGQETLSAREYASAPPSPPRGIKRYLVAPLILLVIALLILRALGAVGLSALASWHTSARLALAAMFCFTGLAHFNRMQGALVRMVPRWMPYPRQTVMATGVLEFLGAVGLLIPATATAAGICLAILLVAQFPANINAAQQMVAIGSKPATPLWFRTLVQIVFIAMLLWATL